MTVVMLSIAAVAIGTAYYMRKRSKLKDGDKDIAKERQREKRVELSRGGSSLPTVFAHILHPEHELFLDFGHTYRCNACLQCGEGMRYRCRGLCGFSVHPTCALSHQMIYDLFQTNLQTFAHKYKHPLSIIEDSSDSKCKHCKNKCKDLIRYYCKTCDKKFHPTCAVHPTRLLSFLHPDHELELKTRPHDVKCSVCYHRGKSNARVYCCTACEFYVHPDCAIKIQYVKSLVHGDHVLVFRPLSSYESVVCKGCNRKCKGWRYTCSVCEGVNYHEDCLLRYETVRSNTSLEEVGYLCKRNFVKALKDGFKDGFKDSFKDDMKEQFHDESVWDLIAQFLEALFS